MKNEVILVDHNDNEIGAMDKLQAHQENRLHRAFSVFIFNMKGEMLIHRRALEKYHSPGLWSNTCCSHPSPGESIEEATKRRLMEEMNLVADLEFVFKFKYQVSFDNELHEHEIDHVYYGVTDQRPLPNEYEVCEFKYISITDLIKDVKEKPEKYTEWFKMCFEKVVEAYIHKQLALKKVG